MKPNITFIVAAAILVVNAVGIDTVKEAPIGFVMVMVVLIIGNIAVDNLLEILIDHFNIDTVMKESMSVDILNEDRYIFHAISAGLTLIVFIKAVSLI